MGSFLATLIAALLLPNRELVLPRRSEAQNVTNVKTKAKTKDLKPTFPVDNQIQT
jgi:hypothetical protein